MDDQGDGTGMRLFFHRERISDRGLEPCFRRPRTTVGRGYAPDNRTAQRRQHALRPWPEALPFKARLGRMGFPPAAPNREMSGAYPRPTASAALRTVPSDRYPKSHQL